MEAEVKGNGTPMSEEITAEQLRRVLDLELGSNDSGKPTVRAYLVELLRKVWTEGEGFNGKRPFGNSGWDYDFVPAMIRAGLVKGRLDEDGYVEEVADRRLDALVLAAIESLGTAVPLTVTPAGYCGPAQHTYTAACDGFHEPGQCPKSEQPASHL